MIEEIVLKANLIPLDMWDFNVILGMDWLSIYCTLVECFTKKIVFRKPRFLESEFEDHRVLPMCVILALEAKRLLHKGCEAYLAHVIDTLISKMTLENVSIVQEFSDVFFEDYPSLPLDRELEFGIDLLLDQLPAELKKLKT